MTHRTRGEQILGLLGWLGLVVVVAAVGALASADAASFYAQLVRPVWAPPASAFGPVWSVLYVLMGIAVWLVWRDLDTKSSPWALPLFAAQLAANALWSWLFFAWRNGVAAFADVVILLVLIALTIAAFRRVSGLAAWLMTPYLAWVCLATALTWSVWQGNPALFK